ncbi:hypothetical protein KSP35_16145 [Aquihabitans sp. G128]|uniref:hypothetical protein n=1 Tax=Aquihabitans sp. G128 TaxID=2849779 RepID=UPI001C22D92F|nr:hypothetical protein [Aquihabitans sp. G128]QXC59896.1 hypothetical protein KSP35_16145 [Aquihabitans sp. G128]
MLAGPSPAGAELVWTVARPDGSAWFEHRVDAPELDDGTATTIDLQRWEDGTDIDDAGTVAFTLRLVSELDGIDELLHDGSLTVVALEGEHRYAVDHDWLLPVGLVGLDTVDEHDGPKLRVTAFLKGEFDSYQVEAYAFRDGTRFAQASSVDSRHTFSANDGTVVGQELVAEFDDVRGWNNLTDQGWGAGWHLLDAADGSYEVKFTRDKKVARVVPFEVADGRIVPPGAIEVDPWVGPTLIVDAVVQGDLDGATDGEGAAFYGDLANAAAWVDIDAVYAQRTATTGGGEDAGAAGGQLDDEATEALQRFFDRAERLVNTWAADLEGGSPPWELGDVLQAEALERELPDYQVLRDAVRSVPDDHPLELNGEATTIGALDARVVRMGELAIARIGGSAQEAEDALAPYRELLANDKLAVFEDHPAPDFLYYTTDRRVIESPEELYEADEWYFEGTTETRGTGTVDGTSVDVVVEGWRVLGWVFDADGNTVDEFETQGQGTSAPKSAFQPRS